jgi:hypothetical protein
MSIPRDVHGEQMAKPQPPWSVAVAGVVVLTAAGIAGVASASDPATRLAGLPAAGVAAVIGCGLLARRRWAVWAGFGLVAVGAVLMAAAFWQDSPVGQMLAWSTGLLLLLLLPMLARRPRHTSADPVSLGAPPSVGQRLLFGLLVVPVLVVAMALVLVGLTSGPRDIGAFLVLIALLLFFGGAAVMFRPRRRILDFDLARLPVDGAATEAFLARFDPVARAAAPAAVAGMAVVGVCMLIEADVPAAVWGPVAVFVGLAVIGVPVLLTTDWRSYVAMVPQGLYVPGVRRPTFVPWAAIQDSAQLRVPHRGGAEPFVVVAVSTPDAISTSVAGRLLHAINRGFGADLYFPSRMLATEPRLLLHALDLYRSSPERRPLIGTADELARLRNQWATSPVG